MEELARKKENKNGRVWWERKNSITHGDGDGEKVMERNGKVSNKKGEQTLKRMREMEKVVEKRRFLLLFT